MPPYEREGWNGGGRSLQEVPTGELVGELVTEAKRLVRSEVKLARAEIKQDVRAASSGATLMGIAYVVGSGGFLALVASLILVLATAIPARSAAAIVGVVLVLIAAVLGAVALARFRAIGMDETMETVKEDGRWASDTMRAARSNRHATA